ncbi:hypothetical protein FD755_006601 [Muntiacus reevesi]|uniref:Methylated-DNA--protein-cysteine methyltransferase n=1 Tax=Muntiacus reevesi TaxID=9886 RepID=A0A5J5MWP3_MUNRE|nr:hypothetical protein FD755_006601 [Muntiacus reevesi]
MTVPPLKIYVVTSPRLLSPLDCKEIQLVHPKGDQMIFNSSQCCHPRPQCCPSFLEKWGSGLIFAQVRGKGTDSESCLRLPTFGRWGGGGQLPVPCLRARSFTRQVLWKLLKLVKFGETVSYQQLAALAGNPRAARAVGGAMRSNPIPILIPCHRVVCSSGAVGNYSGGVGVKEWLLAHEGSPAGKAARGGGSRAAGSWRGALGGTASSQPTGRD